MGGDPVGIAPAAAPTVAPRPSATEPRPGASEAQALREFEAIFIAETLAPLFDEIAEGTFGGGEEAYVDLLRQAVSEAIAERGGFGVADMAQRALIDVQADEATGNAASRTEGNQP